MARVLLTTIGSRGDVYPLLALADAFSGRGHAVTFALEAGAAVLARTAGHSTVVLPGDPACLDPYAATVFGGRPGLVSLSASFRHYILPTLEAKVGVLRPLARTADVVVAPPVHPAAAIAAEAEGTPWVALNVSAAVASPDLDPVPYPLRLPDGPRRLVNRLLWSAGTLALRRLADAPVNRVRRRHGLRPLRFVLAPAPSSARLAAVAVSPAFVPRRTGWPPRLRVTGFCWWNPPLDPTVARRVAGVAAAGRPLVAITGGAASGAHFAFGRHFWRSSLEAVRRLRLAAVLVGAPPDVLAEPLPDEVVGVPEVPFAWLFPRCRLAVHHGGIGTTAHAIRAGIPSLIVPWAFDQAFNAAQVVRLGVGRTVAPRRYTPAAAVQAFEGLLRPPAGTPSLASLAARLVREDGAAQLACAVEELL